VSIQKWLFSPISLLGGNFNPRNINHMPVVKISARLKLDENISFLDGHKLGASNHIGSPYIRSGLLVNGHPHGGQGHRKQIWHQ
jgi:hypothetical protein